MVGTSPTIKVRVVVGALGIVALLLMISAPHARASSTPSIAYISVGDFPGAAVFDLRTGTHFILNFGDATASVISDKTNTVVQTVPAGLTPDVAAFDPSNGNIYVTDCFSNLITVLNGTTGATVATIPTGGGICPEGITYDYRNGYLYAVNSGPLFDKNSQNSNTISVIDGTTNSLVAAIPDPFAPIPTSFLVGAAYDLQTGNIYISDAGYGVQVLNGNTNTFVANIVTPDNYYVVYDQLNGDVYALNDVSPGSVGVIDGHTNNLVENIPMPSACPNPGIGVTDLRNGNIYVACFGLSTTNAVAVVNGATNALVQVFSIGGTCFGQVFGITLCFSVVPDFDVRTGAIYVPIPSMNAVAVISP